ncbi:M14 family metallopeptidase [Candidatus Halobeggiatoa sp. HSG11]|nr:M14 family metallopeptidase [Candidatus Halobeggiatoa sp. HSG11]
MIIRYWLAGLLIFVIEIVTATTPTIDLVTIQIQDGVELNRLQQFASDVDVNHSNLRQGFVTIYADDAEQVILKTAGFNFQVVIENLSDYYAQRAIKDKQTRQAITNSMGGFRTFAEIEQTLEHLSKNFPHIVAKFSIGKSFEGRDIWAIRISDHPDIYEPSEPTVWFDALHHAREAMSGESLLLFASWLVERYAVDLTVTRLINSRNILLIPCVNPDGYEYNYQQHPNGGGLWRKNRRKHNNNSYGVDLNRNYSWEWRYDSRKLNDEVYQGTAPFSEPETAAIRDLLTQQTPSMSVSVHSYGNEWMFPWGYSALPTPDDDIFRNYATKIVATNGYITDTAWNLYGITRGASDDYHYGMYKSLAFTVEIGDFNDGFWPAPTRIPVLFDTVQPGYSMVAQWAGAWAEVLTPVWSEQQGNGDEWFEAGEIWNLSLHIKNEGVLPLDAEVSVSSHSPDILIEDRSINISLEPHQETLTSPLQFHFADMIDSEIPYILDIALNYEGFISNEPLKILLGPPRVLANNLATVAVLGKVAPGNFVCIFVYGAAQVMAEVFWSLETTTAQYLSNIEGAVYLAGNIQPLVKGITDINGQLGWLLQLPQVTELAGKTIYLQALLDYDGKPSVSRLTMVRF